MPWEKKNRIERQNFETEFNYYIFQPLNFVYHVPDR